ncbi:DUF2946 family protein [Pelomonas cellulosilytica]|uniref:DUF2946 family protein n=1 Tax=Pelomonas cellulosilytica TaxID=2906762 RepID=A0ABS8Y304_9BURK|nr:DUF2946 family protein [Pelomonas sp. P8]MCE4558153.1 DUF2946 family protein [Pelomonas sp. P8]
MSIAFDRLRKRQPLLLAMLVLCVLCVQATATFASARMALAGLGGGFADICSAAGSSRANAEDDSSRRGPADPASAGSHAACWACLLTAQGIAPPPVVQPPHLPLGTLSRTTAARVRSAVLRPVTGPGRPRAPPQDA